ncbi:MAG: phosphoglucomutase (alpha-D-glucose-1,6-bisphosphate-dependent) [Truepera sp.]|nr:phosphoglucomutase (alpha-D-glucose-1,6-bisphosphate-dependent) [Truepera sp.]
MKVHPKAGHSPEYRMLANIPRLITTFYTERPDPAVAAERVAFGTSGHRGSSLTRSFNEQHVLAISQAICDYRRAHGINGPLFLGIDTHALSEPAYAAIIEVLAANGVEVMVDAAQGYTPTPVISHAILGFNRGRSGGLADGIVVTPSHNPPEDGGYKYNPPNGGPADTDITRWIQERANGYLEGLKGVQRLTYAKAMRAATTHRYDYLTPYISDLATVIDFEPIRASGIKLAVDPLGGAGVHYWGPIAERYGLNLTVVSDEVDPTFRFMTLDWDGKIRMDPSSSYTMQRLIGLRDRFEVAFACDSDHDRHGIVTRSAGLLPANHYLAVMTNYLFTHRPQWGEGLAVAKTLVSTSLIDRVAAGLERKLVEVPVGFKWFVSGLLAGTFGFVGEESAGATFLRRDGTVWTTDKDGLAPALLAAEMTAVRGRDPGELYQELTARYGSPVATRIDAPATSEQKRVLANLSPEQVPFRELAGEPISAMLTTAPGNGAAIGGLKVVTESGWFAARPSGTEEIYKIYAESFSGQAHLERLVAEAQVIVGRAFETARA